MKRCLLLLVVIALFSACDGNPLDKALDTLDGSISRLQVMGADWQRILADTRDELVKQGQTTIANEVDTVAKGALQTGGIELRCSGDFMRDRVREDLVRIRALLSQSTYSARPHFCTATPPSINMDLGLDRVPLVQIDGYNIDPTVVHAYLEKQTPTGARDVTSALDFPSSYLVTANVANLQIAPDDVRLRFMLGLPGATTTQSVAITRTPKPHYDWGRVRISGSWYLVDDETFGSDETRRVPIADVRNASPAGVGYYREECVGDEVVGAMDVGMVQNDSTADIEVNGELRYYEQDRCNHADLESRRPVSFRLPLGTSKVLNETLADSDGSVQFAVTFTYEQAGTYTASQTRLGR